MVRQYVLLEGPLPSEGLFALGARKDLVGRVNFLDVPGQGMFGGKDHATLRTMVISSVDGGSVVPQPGTGEPLSAIRTGIPSLGMHVGDMDPKAGLVGKLLVTL